MNYEELQQSIEENLPIPSRDELWEAIEKGDLEKYTPRQIEKGMLQTEETEVLAGNKAIRDRYTRYANNKPYIDPNDLDTDTLYHKAAWNRKLHQIPKELLTAENLLQRNNGDRTCLHLAAYHGQLAQIPRELLTAENLLQHDEDHENCLHWAAKKGHLDKLPLSYETLTELIEYFETQDGSCSKEEILETLNELLEKKMKRLEIIARSQEIKHDTDIL